MGIRHLISFLRPFVESESLRGRSVVIDGSAFAHFLFFILLRRRDQAANAFEAIPMYLELVKVTIAWLDQLKKNGVVIKRIYFDGFLPPSKFSTRLERLTKYTSQLLEYYKSHLRPCRASLPVSDESEWLFSSKAVPAKLTCIPPLSFVVPAVIEALFSSEYSEITMVVPAEADLFCAKYADQFDCIILTGDSDLLIHDLGLDGTVCFLKDIELSPEGPSEEIRGLIYHPATIANRLGLSKEHGLRSLAFEIDMDPNGSFGKLHMQAKNREAMQAYPERFDEFLEQYSKLSNPLDKSIKGSCSVFSKLDPRVSEYVLQFPSLARVAGRPDILLRTKQPFHAFLPCLLECPLRTTGWEASTGTRQLAYGLINLIVSHNQQISVVVEHRRQENTSGGRKLQLPTAKEASEACSSLIVTYSSLQEKLPHLTGTQIWTAVAVSQELEWSASQEKSTLTSLAVNYLVTVRDTDMSKFMYDWDIIQFLSVIQSSLYSLRILKQITSVVMSYEKTAQIPDSLVVLFERLQCLPKFPQYQDRGNIDFFLDELPSILIASKSILGIEEVIKFEDDLQRGEKNIILENPNRSAKRAKKKRNRNKSPTSKRQKPNNPFELLDVD